MLKKECSHYEEVLAGLGGVDLQLLGLGHNGHIGFNEPDEEFDKLTHCVNLTEEYHRGQQTFLREGRGRSAPGIHHGHQNHYAGEKDPADRQRCR